MSQDPHVTPSEHGCVVCDAVVWARDQLVGITGRRVLDLPFSAPCRVARPRNLESVSVPVKIGWGNGRGVELANHVVFSGADGPIVVEAPLTDVSIPACLQLANYNELLPFAVYGNTLEVSRIRLRRVKDRPRWCIAPTNSRSDGRPVRPDKAFRKQPVAERTAGIAVVLHVEDRSVGSKEHALATVVHFTQRNAGSVCPQGK